MWNNFVRTHPFSTPYHLWEFGEALSLTYKYSRYYIVARTGNKVLAVFPLILVKSKLFGNKLFSLPFCEYGGPLIDETSENFHVVLSTILKKVLNFKFSLKNLDYVEIRNPKLSDKSLKTMLQFSFQSFKKYVTFRVDLTKGENVLWNELDKKTRNSIRKAVKSSLVVYEANTDNDLQKYYYLYLKTQKRHGSPPHSFELFNNLARVMKENIKIMNAEYHSNIIAGIIAFHDKRSIYWWSSVSDYKFRGLNATNLLLWELIRWGCEKGYIYLDLGRTRAGSGIYHFKKGWAGREILLEDYVYSFKHNSKGTPDPSEGIFRVLSKIWAKIPISVAKKLGPYIIKQIGL